MSNNPGVVQQIPSGAGKYLEASLVSLVDGSQAPGGHADQEAPLVPHADAIHTTGHSQSRRWISRLWPSGEIVDKLFAYEHMGNYVIDRKTGKKIFESMPLYVRVGMHLLFCEAKEIISYDSVESLLRAQSIKQGAMYDKEGPEVLQHINSFIKTYDLPLNELLIEDLTQYPTFNSFFARRLKASARPIDGLADPRVVVSPADCRMTVFETVDSAKRFWIKGREFSIPELLGHDERFGALQRDPGCMLCIARLAPQDYHRFHSPVEGVVHCVKDIEGELYNLNVFTKNKRSVMLLHANLGPGRESVPVALVAIGGKSSAQLPGPHISNLLFFALHAAMLVGSIGWSKAPGDTIAKGAEIGWFAYGGSTVVCVFPGRGVSGVRFDDDLVETSERGMEMVVQVGNRIAGVQ